MSKRYLIQRALAFFSMTVCLLSADSLWAQNSPFQMAGVGVAPEGLSLFVPGPHFSQGGGNVLGPHRGAGTFVANPTTLKPIIENDGVVGYTVEFSSGEKEAGGGFNFTTRDGVLATDYGTGPDKAPGTPGVVEFRILRMASPTVAIVKAIFLANFEIDPGESTGKFHGCTGRWYMEARSNGPLQLDLSNGQTTPFRYSWRAIPGTGSIECE